MPVPSARFTASYDRTAIVVSAVVCAAFLLVAVALHSLIVGVVSALLLLVAYAYSPRSYRVSGDAITIERLIGKIDVPLAGLREARAATAEDLQGTIRLFGSGGLFGYYGLFRTARLGKCRWYVTNRSKTIVVRTEDRVVLLSPDEPDAMLATLHPQTVAGPPLFESLGESQHSWAGAFIGAAAILVGLAAVGGAMLYAPGPPAYTLTPDALTIHDRFYPVTLRADGVDVGQIQIVDFSAHPEWRPTLRTNGFSVQHYHSGWYRVAGGKTVRMYRADGMRLVLLPPRGEGTPVLFEAPEPERFAAEVRQAWNQRF